MLLDHAIRGALQPSGRHARPCACSVRCIRPASHSSWSPISSARTATTTGARAGSTEPLVALTDDSFNYLFVGAVPVILLLWFGIAGGGAFRRGRMLIAAIAALALIYALGRYTPAFAWAFDWVPGVSRFRRPVDAQLRLRRDACVDLRRAARRLYPRGRAAPAAAGERRRGAARRSRWSRPASSSPAVPTMSAMRSKRCR